VARAVPRERAAAALQGLRALREEDQSGFAEAARELGVLTEAGPAYAQARFVLGPLLSGPARLDGPALAATTRRALERLGPLLGVAAQASLQPADLPALRMLGQLAALLSRLGATEDWARLAAP
jgi:hypothetical protein